MFQQIFNIYHAKIALKTLFIARNIVQNFNIFQRWKLLRERENKKYRNRSWATPSVQKLIKLCDWMYWIRTIGWEFYALLSTLFNNLIHLHIKWSYFFRFVCSILLHTWANGMCVLVCTTAWQPVRVHWVRTYMVACGVACVRYICNTYWILKNETMKIKID